jgi:hypothetical protein
MNKKILRSFVAMGALATACASWGCVADRPSRNGVFNENQYIRKDFLTRPATGGNDPGWFMKATIVQTSTPNPLMAQVMSNGTESADSAGFNTGSMPFVRWIVTSDKLQVANMREISNAALAIPAQATREPEILNAWPIVNVDLKYEINLDGEITNFFQENQEADWQQRQWVKVSFDKNDMSDFAPLGSSVTAYLAQCGTADISTTLVPGSFLVDETNNYMTWQIQLTVPVNVTDQTCVDSYGTTGQQFLSFGRTDVTMTLMYSFVRAASDSGRWDNIPTAQGGRNCNADLTCPKSSYTPWVMAEKDPIQRKYGLFHQVEMNRDPTTDLLTSQAFVQRWNPNATFYDLYLAPGFPAEYEQIFCGYEADGFTMAAGAKCGSAGTGGIVDQTNTLWKNAGANLRMRIWHNDDDTSAATTANPEQGYGLHGSSNPKVFGDVRYGFIRFITDIDSTPTGYLGVTEPLGDPRTGELLTATINIANLDLQDFYGARLEFYLETIGGTGATQKNNPEQITNGAFPTIAGTCTVGDIVPLGGPGGQPDNSQGGAVQFGHNAISTVFQKMQAYLHKPVSTYGYLGPDDFIPQEDSDFFAAFNKIIPYEIFRDPNTNPFVIQEGGTGNYAPAAQAMTALTNQHNFNTFMSNIDHGGSPMVDIGNGAEPYDPTGPQGLEQAAAFTAEWQSLTKGYTDSRWALQAARFGKMDTAAQVLGYFKDFDKSARHCVQNNLGLVPNSTTPHWETLPEWIHDLVLSVWQYTIWHEFGHSIGLDHNFMGSVDRNNYPTWCLGGMQSGSCSAANTRMGSYTSSIMEYPASGSGDLFLEGGSAAKPDGTAGTPLNPAWNGHIGWMPYDQAAISFIYANAQTAKTAVPIGTACSNSSCTVSGQVSATAPWNDKAGYNGAAEVPYLWCSDEHTRYSPFCQTFDFGTTPSEIMAAALDQEEWFYKWNNFRLYHKYWDDSTYAGQRAFFYHDILRFLSAWSFDWNPAELPQLFVKLGVTPPAGVPEQSYYTDLVNSFTNDMSIANQMVAAFHLAMVEQASGERPYITTFDPFYGDVTQQGIIIDKNAALNNFTNLYQADNYDVNQAAGVYLFAASPIDSNYASVTQNVVSTLVGGQYDIFPYDVPLAVANFAATTQNIYFPQVGNPAMREWIGGKVFGGVEIDPNTQFLDWAHNLAAQWGFMGCSSDALAACPWDPRQTQNNPNQVYQSDPYNEFRGPDNRRYAWAPITDRNQILLVDRDWNTATYIIVRNWNTDVTFAQDDGSGGAYQLELPMKYFLNAYDSYN